MVGLWNGVEAAERIEVLRGSSEADLFAATLREATRLCIESAGPVAEAAQMGLEAQPA
jgi:hypothetical protein